MKEGTEMKQVEITKEKQSLFTFRIEKSLKSRMKKHCVLHEVTIKDWLEELIEKGLRNE